MHIQPATEGAYRLLHEGALALASVEQAGMRVDEAYLDGAVTDTRNRITELEKQLLGDKVWRLWRKRYGDRAKLGSTQQLGVVVFDDLGFSHLAGQTETGKRKLDEDAFSHVPLEFTRNYFLRKRLEKVYSTYLLGFKRELVGGYLHPFFNLHTTRTYRSSADSPNFQNIPIRNKEIAELVRKCFIPRKGRHFVEMDFSGLEVRIAACYNKDKNLIRYIEDPSTDMHRDTACRIYLLKPGQVEKRMSRDWSKNRAVFPMFYGSVYFQCAPHLWEPVLDEGNRLPDGRTFREHLAAKGVTELGACDPKEKPKKGTFEYVVKQAEDYFWQENFTEYNEWKKRWWEGYQKLGYIEFLTGFIASGLMKRNDTINYGIQGSAFHCLLWCLTRLVRWLEKNRMRSLIVGQIHDSINGDFHPSEIQEILGKAKEIMTVDLPRHWPWIIVPMDTEVEVAPKGESWFHKAKWESRDGLWQAAT